MILILKIFKKNLQLQYILLCPTFDLEQRIKKVSQLFESLHSIMLQNLCNNLIFHPPIHLVDTSKPLPPSFDPNIFCQYPSSLGHDTK